MMRCLLLPAPSGEPIDRVGKNFRIKICEKCEKVKYLVTAR